MMTGIVVGLFENFIEKLVRGPGMGSFLCLFYDILNLY